MAIRLKTALTIASIAAAGTGAGGLVEDHTMSVATVAAVFTIVLPATWWVSSRLTKLQAKLEELYHIVNKLDCNKCPVKDEKED